MQIDRSVLDNGVRVTTCPKDTPGVAIAVFVRAGSRDEEFLLNGGAWHYVEHMAFKGSRKYSLRDVKLTIERVGGSMNALTSHEFTCFYVKVLAKDLELAIDLLLDIILHPNWDEAEFGREIRPILEEMRGDEDDPFGVAVNKLLPTLLYAGHQLSRPIIGSEDVLRALTLEDIRALQDTYYVPGNIVVVVCGPVDHDDVVKRLAERMSHLQPAASPERLAATEEISAELCATRAKPIQQAHLAIGARAYGYGHPDLRATQVLRVILGAGMSSRLFYNVRDVKGLVYTAAAISRTFADAGHLVVYGAMEPDGAKAALEALLIEIEDIMANPVDEVDELAKAKQMIIAGTLMGLPDSDDIAMYLGQGEINGRTTTIEEFVAQIDAVTADDVQRVARQIFALDGLRLSVVAPDPEPIAAEFRRLIAGRTSAPVAA